MSGTGPVNPSEPGQQGPGHGGRKVHHRAGRPNQADALDRLSLRQVRNDGKFPEINIVRCDVALLTLDRPVKNLSELGSRKITGVELRDDTGSGVRIENNRGYKAKTDHLEVTIRNAPVFYDDSRNIIESEGDVTVVDRQRVPIPDGN